MNWEQLFQMQNDLDAYINRNHQLEGKHLFEEKFLALLVELGELANETRCFKFWSNKPSSKREVVLEEYVDNIHFLLSLGLEKEFAFSKIHIAENAIQDKTLLFNDVFRKALTFYEQQTEENYLNLVQAYLQLARLLGFSEAEIFTAYLEKNEVNYERQNSGY